MNLVHAKHMFNRYTLCGNVKKIRQVIENYFKINLSLPEFLNRIGKNIVVYDYIRLEVTKKMSEQ